MREPTRGFREEIEVEIRTRRRDTHLALGHGGKLSVQTNEPAVQKPHGRRVLFPFEGRGQRPAGDQSRLDDRIVGCQRNGSGGGTDWLLSV